MNYYRQTSRLEKIEKLWRLFSLSLRIKQKQIRDSHNKPFSVMMIVPNLDRVGGYEIQAQQLAANLADLGQLVTIITNEPSGERREFRNGFLIHRIGSSYRRLFSFFRRSSKCSVVHVHGICGFSLFAIRLAAYFRIPSILKIATKGDASALFTGNGFKKRFYRHWIKKTRTFVAVSEEIAQEIKFLGMNESRIASISNFVNTAFFHKCSLERKQEIRQKLNAQNDLSVFLYLGRLEKRKGVDLLLRSWKNAGVLWIVGKGPESARLKELSAELKLENVHFFGETSDPLPFYQAADVFVFPSFAEGAPNVLLEAMSCALPVIATRIGGIVDQVEDKQQGLLVSAGSSEELSAAMEYAGSHPDQMKKWSEQAEIRAREKFDIEKVTARYLELYLKMTVESGCYNNSQL